MDIKLTFLGDIMSEKIQNEACYYSGKYDYSEMFDDSIKDYFSKSDCVIGNLETPIAGENAKYSYEIYSFNTPKEFLLTLKNIGIKIVSTANNHCLDRGTKGLLKTMENLEDVGIEYTGTHKEKNNRIFIKEIKGIKFAILSYTYDTNAVFNKQYLKNKEKYMVNLFKHQEQVIKKYNIIRRFKRKMQKINVKSCRLFDYIYLNRLKKDIKLAKKNADYVIMNMHSGGQYNEIVDDYTVFLSDFLLKCGVDFVIGAHPHVVHPSFIRDNKFCAYSLGNFCCTPWMYELQKDNLPDYSIILNIYANEENKKISKITFSIAKSVKVNDKLSKVFLVDKLLKQCSKEEKNKIIKEKNKIIEIFINKKIKDLNKENDEYIINKGENNE